MCRRAKSGRPGQLALFLAALVAALAISLLLAGVAWGDAVTPEAGPTQNAVKPDTLYKIVLVLGLGVLALVWGVLFSSLVRSRARRGRVPPQFRGNAPLELGWTLGAVTLVTVIAVITLLMLGDIRDPARSGPAALAEAQNE